MHELSLQYYPVLQRGNIDRERLSLVIEQISVRAEITSQQLLFLSQHTSILSTLDHEACHDSCIVMIAGLYSIFLLNN